MVSWSMSFVIRAQEVLTLGAGVRRGHRDFVYRKSEELVDDVSRRFQELGNGVADRYRHGCLQCRGYGLAEALCGDAAVSLIRSTWARCSSSCWCTFSRTL